MRRLIPAGRSRRPRRPHRSGRPHRSVRASVATLQAGFAGRLVVRFVAASGYDRALALAAQAFVALVPAALLTLAYFPVDQGAAVTYLIDRFGLTGDGAEAVRELVARPRQAGTPGAVGGVVLVVMTGIGFTRTLQRLYVSAWVLSPLGLRGFLHALLAVVALVAAVLAAVVFAPSDEGPHPVAALAVQALIAAVLWLPIQRLLVGDRVTLRRLLPGAVVTGVGQTLATLLSGPYLRLAVGEQADRFGVLGVAFVLVSWLLVLAYLLVGAAVFGAELAGAPVPGSPATRPDPDPDPEPEPEPDDGDATTPRTIGGARA
ncbi:MULTISPECIES: YhjD/YihY/BrkB family envelope integrity protein [unclassified Pseudonocardia]|uniref:YhjD/YihY/BrkB family envelope integrity protein n=1 Tax=unclassified Pseudonocardia TaxID=2619320 RepID=UPI0004925082|nr:YhjD/YihY/BrkB family envelope integrity protein [Pseudonocardia sp. Ae707_Ps1]OLM17615.1 putative integral membrane protein [Pseudonocardia sp. Ae707_Ps1]